VTLSFRGLSVTTCVLLALMGWATSAAARSSSPLRECGHHGWIEATGRVGWTYDIQDVTGAGMFNVTARVAGCPTARRVALRALSSSEGYDDWYWNGWRCRFVKQRYEWSKIRCSTVRGRTVQWVTAA
jgi:hypothetical protein